MYTITYIGVFEYSPVFTTFGYCNEQIEELAKKLQEQWMEWCISRNPNNIILNKHHHV